MLLMLPGQLAYVIVATIAQPALWSPGDMTVKPYTFL